MAVVKVVPGGYTKLRSAIGIIRAQCSISIAPSCYRQIAMSGGPLNPNGDIVVPGAGIRSGSLHCFD